MSDEAGFLRAIADKPAERSTRLVYADWLDEHGRPREAEFLRLQIQAAEMNARLLEMGGELDVKWLTAVGGVRAEPQKITLRSGRWVLIQRFRQWRFYESLLEGVPTSEANRARLGHLVASEREQRHHEPYVIPPVEKPFDPLEDWARGDEPQGMYPAIVCVALLRDFAPVKDTDAGGSELPVIWFQHEWAFPIDPGVYEQIRAIDWEKHAHDFGFD